MLQVRGNGTSATGTTASLTCNKPTGTLETDEMLAIQSTRQGSFSGGIPSGWAVEVESNTFFHARVLRKRAGAGEGSSFSFGGNSSPNAHAVAIVSVQEARDVRTSAAGSFGTFGTTVVAPTLTALSGGALVLRLAAYSPATNATPPASHTEKADAAVADMGVTIAVQDALAAAGSVGTATFTMGTAADNGKIAFTVAFYPTPSGILLAYQPFMAAVHRSRSW